MGPTSGRYESSPHVLCIGQIGRANTQWHMYWSFMWALTGRVPSLAVEASCQARSCIHGGAIQDRHVGSRIVVPFTFLTAETRGPVEEIAA